MHCRLLAFLTLVCMADDAFPRKVAFLYLDSIMQRFTQASFPPKLNPKYQMIACLFQPPHRTTLPPPPPPPPLLEPPCFPYGPSYPLSFPLPSSFTPSGPLFRTQDRRCSLPQRRLRPSAAAAGRPINNRHLTCSFPALRPTNDACRARCVCANSPCILSSRRRTSTRTSTSMIRYLG
jgi:hypothetical protein